jgi:flagellar protein FlgJ
MNLRTIASAAESFTNLTPPATGPKIAEAKTEPKTEAKTEADKKTEADTKKAFTDFVGQTLFGSMLASMRKSVGKAAYMHGGRTEEVFQKQLDQKIVEQLTDASAQEIADPMYELFNMQRRSG